MQNPSTQATSLSIPTLRDVIRGEVIAPDDAGFDEARAVFYGIDRKPAVIIRPADANEVAYVISVARDTSTELAVRSGGHSLSGYSVVDDGIVLDLTGMKGLHIDTAQKSVWAQAGLTAGELTKAVGEHGLAIGFGDTGTVGIGGITLGGGVGFLVRKFGLTIDSLLAAELVTADGRVLEVDESTHPDLFWAIRGGGGNFGVVTRFKFALSEVDRVFGGMLMLPATADVIESFVALSEAAPVELSGIANVMLAPPMPFVPEEIHGTPVLFGIMVYAGDPAEGEKVLAPFRRLATPIMNMLKEMRYPEIYEMLDEGDGPGPTGFSIQNMFLDGVDHDAASLIVESLNTSTADMAVVQLRVLGGAVDRVDPDATAFAHRGRRMMANVAAMYQDRAQAGIFDAWVDDLSAKLRRGSTGVYVNFLGDEGPDRLREAYPGATWERLGEVKRRYDPANLFHRNQNIPPG